MACRIEIPRSHKIGLYLIDNETMLIEINMKIQINMPSVFLITCQNKTLATTQCSQN
jgi:hypothetical protein